MGKDRPGAGAEGGVRAVKPPPDRLYGRARGHTLRPRQQRLLDVTLPRLLLPGATSYRQPEGMTGMRAGLASRLPAKSIGYQRPDRLENGQYVGPLVSVPTGRLWMEIGFGGGEHTLAQVRAHPEVTLIACEVFENGICSLLSALVPEGVVPEDVVPEGVVPEGEEATAPLPPNLRLWTDDARILLQHLPDACLERLFLMFPDPWPKARHAKRRFVHPATLPLLARVLKPGGEWRIASDDPTYQTWVRDVMESQTLFSPETCTEVRPAGWPPTRYEAKALRAGRTPLYWVFRRSSAIV